MIPKIIVIWTFLYLAVTQIRSDTPNKEDLQDEYYTVATTYTDKFQPSDERDAQAILDSDNDAKVIAGIFLYREKVRRNAISKQIWIKIQNIFNHTVGLYARRRLRRSWIREPYMPQCQKYFSDLLYGLIFDENYVLTAYLRNFFHERLEKRINIAMVLTKDMQAMINVFGPDPFKIARKHQRNKFEHMLRVWVRFNREPLEKDDPSPDVIKANANALKKEQDDGGWHENRDQIELITMKKSIKFARAVIKEFEKLNNGMALENILNDNIKKCDLNENLADTYGSLVRYIKNKHKYIAKVMADNCDGSDQWAAWILCIAVVHPQEWPKIDEAFKEIQKGTSLSKFIMEKITTDKTLAEAMAVAVDSKFKPTTFSKIPIDNSPIPPPPSPSNPPPASP